MKKNEKIINPGGGWSVCLNILTSSDNNVNMTLIRNIYGRCTVVRTSWSEAIQNFVPNTEGYDILMQNESARLSAMKTVDMYLKMKGSRR